jgi:Putative auto-transporter adhesin, head GIN domain
MVLRIMIIALAAFGSHLVAAERTYSINDFDEIRIIGAQQVDVNAARATTVRASGDTTTLDMLSIESRNRVLTIRTVAPSGSSAPNATAHRPARVTVTLPQLRTVLLIGSGTASVAEMRGPQVSASLTGSGVLLIKKLNADRAVLRLAGAGTITAVGKVQNLDVNAKGSGDFDGAKLLASDLKLNSAGSGKLALSASRGAVLTVTGSGDVVVAGNPACTVENTGSGTVSCGTE